MNTQDILLQVRDLTVSLGQGRPVDGVSFDIRKGETFALLGESGCGKSMTALALMRLLPDVARIAGGMVGLADKNILDLTEAEMRRVRGGAMAMIFQEPGTSLNPVLTVGYQIGEALAVHRDLKGSVALARSVKLLKAVGISDPEQRCDEYPFQLSGGMKQRVMIAMALAGEPELLIADEPTTALDVTIQGQVLDLLVQLQQQRRMAMLLITHDLGVVARMADRVGVMYAGHLVETGDRANFFATPAHPYSRKLFAALPDANSRGARLATIPGRVPALDTAFVGCRFADRCSEVMDHCRTVEPAWYSLQNGQQVRCHLYANTAAPVFATPSKPEDAPAAGCSSSRLTPHSSLLEVADLKVHFPIRRGILQRTVGHVRAVDGVSLQVEAGKTLALVGESGCGKTTVGKAILQLVKPTSGSVRLHQQELTTLTPKALRVARASVQMVFQDPYASLNPRMRISNIIAEGMAAMKLPGDHPAQVAELMQRVGLAPEMASRFPHEFSGGQRQRIAIARALAVSPQLLVCDEPTSALDVSVQAQILNLLRDLQASLQLAYLFITHNIAVVDYLADQVAVMYLGRIVESGTTEEVLRDPRHPYTAALIAAVPHIDGEKREVLMVPGDMPSASNPPGGCHFHPRCPHAMDVCKRDYPEQTQLSTTRVVRCHLYPG